MGIQRDGAVGTGDPTDAAVIAYFGDGATSQGDVNEAFVFAGVNNARSCSSARTTSGRSPSRIERQTRIPLYRGAKGSASPASVSTATTCWPCMP
jgi:2-oxoisovalerate dehydrogenase E1 component alpha subunit